MWMQVYSILTHLPRTFIHWSWADTDGKYHDRKTITKMRFMICWIQIQPQRLWVPLHLATLQRYFTCSANSTICKLVQVTTFIFIWVLWLNCIATNVSLDSFCQDLDPGFCVQDTFSVIFHILFCLENAYQHGFVADSNGNWDALCSSTPFDCGMITLFSFTLLLQLNILLI
jgi:hypothetical protein